MLNSILSTLHPSRWWTTQSADRSIDADAARIRRYFDPQFYLQSNPDVARANIDPLEHYLLHGWREGRNPSSTFDTNYYLSRYMKEGDHIICPLLHYAEYGESQGWLTNYAAETERSTKETNRLLSEQFLSLLKLLRIENSLYRRELFDSLIVSMFSADYYTQKKGLESDYSTLELLLRYLSFDFASGLPPGPLFDEDHYRNQVARSDLPPLKSGQPEFLHWLEHGVAKRISPSPLYVDDLYLAMNKDLHTWPTWLFYHFVNHGVDENRQFASAMHITANPVKTAIYRPQSRTRSFVEWCGRAPGSAQTVQEMQRFLDSEEVHSLIREASMHEPTIGTVTPDLPRLLPPWHDGMYAAFAEARKAVKAASVDTIILMPFCKLGGSDYVASLVAHAMAEHGSVAVLRTDRSDWERPDWFPHNIITCDLSGYLNAVPESWATRILYEVVRDLKPLHVFNINSNLAFRTMRRYGKRMSVFARTYVYYFCADLTLDGRQSGYPIWYFADLLPSTTAALIDNRSLATELIERYHLPEDLASKVGVLYTPAVSGASSRPAVRAQVATSERRPRPLILWAGRLDRQKRFDLVLEIARQLPEVDFRCWGKAVLDAPPKLDDLPPNVELMGTFESYNELPLGESEGWLYTALWDGLPTILIECGAKGIPIVASAVGGVPELIDEETGWPVHKNATASEYVEAIVSMIADPNERIRRAENLRERVKERHSYRSYRDHLTAFTKGLLEGSPT